MLKLIFCHLIHRGAWARTRSGVVLFPAPHRVTEFDCGRCDTVRVSTT